MYDDAESAGESLAEKPETREDTFFLPAGFEGEPGEILSVKVVGKTEDGRLEVEKVKESAPEEEEDLVSTLRKDMAAEPEE